VIDNKRGFRIPYANKLAYRIFNIRQNTKIDLHWCADFHRAEYKIGVPYNVPQTQFFVVEAREFLLWKGRSGQIWGQLAAAYITNYHAYRKMVAVKIVFVRCFGGNEKNGGRCSPRPPWLRARDGPAMLREMLKGQRQGKTQLQCFVYHIFQLVTNCQIPDRRDDDW